MLDADADRADLELWVIARAARKNFAPLRRKYVAAFTDVLPRSSSSRCSPQAERARRFDDQVCLRQMSSQVTAIAMTILIRSGAKSAAVDRRLSALQPRTPCRKTYRPPQ
ncbi:hypothetical protein [Bradyrhizobium sp. CB2312]|uniref:hypothetical protein n=1 Tax=Bradyrhizobium sp. CB2312 TaxID=3039155 RepID=UPI0024B157CD|nr:hypothetical protein [Bradyrhizobium sp. CB2312]WFU77243.1 hypothetical protein QA642_38995 [Bradyrhizobium sp. CB2312]